MRATERRVAHSRAGQFRRRRSFYVKHPLAYVVVIGPKRAVDALKQRRNAKTVKSICGFQSWRRPREKKTAYKPLRAENAGVTLSQDPLAFSLREAIKDGMVHTCHK